MTSQLEILSKVNDSKANLKIALPLSAVLFVLIWWGDGDLLLPLVSVVLLSFCGSLILFRSLSNNLAALCLFLVSLMLHFLSLDRTIGLPFLLPMIFIGALPGSLVGDILKRK